MDDSESQLVRALQRAVILSERGGTGLRAVPRVTRSPAFFKSVKSLGGIIIRKALDNVLCGPRAALGLEELNENGILSLVLPSVSKMIGFGGGSQGHKDLWEHTKKVVEQADDDPIIKWSALFHDTGKMKAFAVRDNRISFHGHEVQSSREFKDFCKESGLFPDDAERKRISQIILHLGRVEAYEGEWTDSAVRRLDKDLGPILDDLIRLSRADITTGRDEKRIKILRSIDVLVNRVAKLRLEAAAPKLPKGLGLVLSERFSIPADRTLGDLMAKLDSRIKSGEIDASSNVEDCVKYVEANKDELFGEAKLRTV